MEGTKNFFGEYGYNRDGKKGKQQIVIGLLCDEFGEPVSTEVFAGNTQDPQTFASPVRKAAQRFGCERVTFGGDRGMIKIPQIENLAEGFHYIIAITKSQLYSMIDQNVIQIELFDEDICEVADDGIRYILRRISFGLRKSISHNYLSVQVLKNLLRKKTSIWVNMPELR